MSLSGGRDGAPVARNDTEGASSKSSWEVPPSQYIAQSGPMGVGVGIRKLCGTSQCLLSTVLLARDLPARSGKWLI